MNLLLEVIDMAVEREGRSVITNASFRIQRGEIVALIGTSGSGKSTVLSAIVGAIPCKSGAVYVDGNPVDCNEIPITKCSFLPQDSDSILLPWKSARKHLLWAASSSSMIDSMLLGLDLEELQDRLPRQLSGGQQRRLALATVLSTETPLFVLDEPFTGLDLDVKPRCWDVLHKQIQEKGGSALLVTHSLEEAAVLCDRAIFLTPKNPPVTTQVGSETRSTFSAGTANKPPSDRYANLASNGCGHFAEYLKKTFRERCLV